jgi:chromosome partitioning protein
MKTIALLNQKGGVSKTTSAISIAFGLAKLGKKILLIDLDPQASLSVSLGIEQPEYSVYDFLKQDVSFEKVAVKKGKVTVIPSSIDLSGFEQEFRNASAKEFILKKALSGVKGYDYIYIDCAPSLALLTINALAAAQEVYIPVQCEFLALQGLGQLIDTLNVVRQRINKDLKMGGIIGTRYNRRKRNKDVMEYLFDNFKDKAFKTVIRENVSISECPSFGKDIYSHAPESNGAADYFALCKEILSREL